MEELIGLLIGGIIGWLTKENAELRNNANNQAKSSHHNQSNYTETQSNFRGGIILPAILKKSTKINNHNA